MRYAISAPVHFEEATPRGLLTADFPEGVVEVEDGSEEHFVAEYRLIPAGVAERVPNAPKAKAKAKTAPEDPAPAPADSAQE